MIRRLIILLLIVGCEEPLEPEDCAGVEGGTAELDNCGVCDADLSNDCIQDCAGVWGGEAGLDNCGVCGGGCVQDCADVWGGAAMEDCAGECGGTAWESDCGCVAADNSGDDCDDCLGFSNGYAYLDGCGVCDILPYTDGVELWGVCYNIAETTELDLFMSDLTGEIPSEIGNLTNLTLLNLSSNQLIGEIPPEIGNLTNLISLALYTNQLTGQIPSEIGNLTNLIDLYLSYNQLTGEIPPEVCDLIESNTWTSGWTFEDFILSGNNLINTCN